MQCATGIALSLLGCDLETHLDKQGPDGEDDFTVFVIYGSY